MAPGLFARVNSGPVCVHAELWFGAARNTLTSSHLNINWRPEHNRNTRKTAQNGLQVSFRQLGQSYRYPQPWATHFLHGRRVPRHSSCLHDAAHACSVTWTARILLAT